MIKRPNSKRHLDDAIRRKYGQESFVQVRTMLANAIVAKMLPEGVIKGGTSLKMRFGNAATQYTTNLDAARLSDTEKYLCDLQENLKIGWDGFAGRLITKEPAAPVNVPTEYIMHPFEIKLSYMGKAWVTVVLEVGHNEIGDADVPDLVIPEEASTLLHELGFPSLKHVPLMQLSHQIAQKLHALSAPGSDRIHDLVDLQIIIDSSETLNYKEIRYILVADPNLLVCCPACTRPLEPCFALSCRAYRIRIPAPCLRPADSDSAPASCSALQAHQTSSRRHSTQQSGARCAGAFG